LNSKYSHIIELLLDLVLCAVAFTLAFLLRFDFNIPSDQFRMLSIFIAPAVFIKVVTFFLMGLYRTIWKYASVKDFLNILWAVLLSSLVIVLIVYFFYQGPFPRSVIAIDGVLTLAFITGFRFIIRGFKEFKSGSFKSQQKGKPVLIAGAGDTGATILREILKNPAISYLPVGLIDDDPAKLGSRLHGIKVLGNRQQMKAIIAAYQIEEVIICMPTASREIIRDIFFLCQEAGVPCKTLPGVYQLIDGTVNVSLIKEVEIEDILGREPIKVDLKQISDYITNKPVLITGAGGSIGSELCRQIIRLEPSLLIMVDQSENSLFEIQQELIAGKNFKNAVVLIADITDKNRINSIFKEYHPSVVFHSAAYKHVPMMESNPLEAIQNNVIGTKIVAETAIEHGIDRFVLLSTDKAVHPSSYMGLSKAIAENILQSYQTKSPTKFMAVRFGNVLDSSGSVIPIFKKQIAQGGPVTVTDINMTRYFMTIPEAMQLVIQAGAIGNGGEIFILDMGEQISITELARNMIILSGFEPEKDIPITFTGIRPGEKLKEKLLWDHESSLPTSHSKIMMVKNSKLDYDKFNHDIAKLQIILGSGDYKAVQALFADICSNYLKK
jgi:FlaA1/EpsC-like NDP-sugar epimerase